MRLTPTAAALIFLFLTAASAAEKAPRFWNLTSSTVTDLRLAPAGTDAFGDNQCLNDKDAEVDHDERLKIADIADGRYDAKIGFSKGRICHVKNLSIAAGKVFSIEDKDLVDCTK
jgi:hypothetical protein